MQWSLRDGPHPQAKLEPPPGTSIVVVPAVPPACHKQRSPAVSSRQPRSLRGRRWTGRTSLTWGSAGARNYMTCKRSPTRIDPAVPGWPIRRPPLCLEAGIAYLVVVGEDGACRCPFGVRRQQRVGRLSGTTPLLPSQDKTHQLASPREHLFPRLGMYGARVSPRVWRSKQDYLRLQTGAGPGRGSDRGRSRPDGTGTPGAHRIAHGTRRDTPGEPIQGGTTPRHPPSLKAWPNPGAPASTPRG
jgi:hypothetical protein